MLACIVGACKKKDKTAGEDDVPVIDVAQVTIDTVTVHKSYPAYLAAVQEVDLVARVDGYLTSAPYKPGDFVKAGTVLYTIESSQYADQVRQAAGSLKDAESEYAYAAQHYAAMQKALESDAVSRMEVLQAKSAMETAQAAIQTAKAQLQSAQTTLSYCTVRAPFNGHVTLSDYSNGAYLSGSGAPVKLGTIYDDAKIKVNFTIDESEFAQMKANANDTTLQGDMTRMPLTFDTPLPHQYAANLRYVAPAMDKSTGTMQLQAIVDNPYGELHSGMYCKINLPQEFIQNAMLVRDASISTDQLGKYVYLVTDSNKVVYTPIEVGETVNDTLRVVTSGLKPGDRYVTKALLKVRDGMTVKPRLVK